MAHCKRWRDNSAYFVFAFMKFMEYAVIAAFGGMVYCMIEVMYRGFTHWSMAIVGGLALVLVGLLNECNCMRKVGLIPQMIIGALIITALEFVSGCIVNLWLGWNVWDYSEVPFNVLGQICIPFTFFWFLLSGVAIVADDYIRFSWFHEALPHYHMWKCGHPDRTSLWTPDDDEYDL